MLTILYECYCIMTKIGTMAAEKWGNCLWTNRQTNQPSEQPITKNIKLNSNIVHSKTNALAQQQKVMQQFASIFFE